ncbi:sister chromatid separation protein [Teratosphaeria destructans]|uniref:Sister chromatid separation protein n=1 Tax=Teratosphaeria destructans TaxID=418781 RepID=A0A9W7T199_9PEZI|nr:sister chromatid separation protein [Teratosphaeria destructans]
MDDQAYLQPGFDPNSLTMPRLRSILVAHNVPYPASAKKQLLVDTFNHHVRPQARSLRNASARVKRTSRGIENVPSVGGGGSSSQSTAEEDDDDEVPVPPSTGRGSRRTTRARTEEVQEVEPTPRATRHSTAPPEHTPRRSSSKHARPSEAPTRSDRRSGWCRGALA